MMISNPEFEREPPILGSIWYVVALLGTVFFGLNAARFWPIAFLLMIVLYHGTREAVHGTLYPTRIGFGQVAKAVTFWLSSVGFAIVGHNFLLLRWSHAQHHAHGRDRLESTLDGSAAAAGVRGRVAYYAGLLGWSFWYHIGLGFLYLLPASWYVVDPAFKPRRYGRALYVFTQIQVTVVFMSQIYLSSGWFFLPLVAFGVYWGTMQNVAHYGLEIGSRRSVLVARTYRVLRPLEVALFRGGFYHLEHHAFPRIPGLLLNRAAVGNALIRKYGIIPLPRHGYLNYVADALRQFQGPIPTRTDRLLAWCAMASDPSVAARAQLSN
jgi:fatty acid desaturase